MEIKFLKIVFCSFFLILILWGTNADLRLRRNVESKYSPCERSGGYYTKLMHFTCCQNETLENAFKEGGSYNFSHCSEELGKVDDDNWPTATWRVQSCILKTIGAKEKNMATFKGYMDFITVNYTEPLKSKILESIEECQGTDTETDELKRLQRFDYCMYKTENKVCQSPYQNRSEVLSFELEATENKQKTCEGIEVDSPHFEQCCKGIKPPTYTNPIIAFTPIKEIADLSLIRKCSQTFIDQQRELNPNIKKGEETRERSFIRSKPLKDQEYAYSCENACKSTGIHFTSKETLKINIEEIKKLMFTAFSASAKKELLLLFDKYVGIKIYSIPDIKKDNSTISVQDAVQLMSMENELIHIKTYCGIHDIIYQEIMQAVIEDYCLGEEYAKKHLPLRQQSK